MIDGKEEIMEAYPNGILYGRHGTGIADYAEETGFRAKNFSFSLTKVNIRGMIANKVSNKER